MEPSIECHALLARLGEDELLVIDCRDERGACESQVQIPGSLRLDFDELVECVHSLPDDELIVLVGCEPGDADSRRAWRLLWAQGHEVVCLRGGFPAWIRGGFPTEPYVSRSERVARRRQAAVGELAVAGEG